MNNYAATFISRTSLENLKDSFEIFADEFSDHFNQYNLNTDLMQEITTTIVSADSESEALEILDEEWIDCYDKEDLQFLYFRKLKEGDNPKYDFKVYDAVIKKLIQLYPNNTSYIRNNKIHHHGVFTMLSSQRIVNSVVFS